MDDFAPLNTSVLEEFAEGIGSRFLRDMPPDGWRGATEVAPRPPSTGGELLLRSRVGDVDLLSMSGDDAKECPVLQPSFVASPVRRSERLPGAELPVG